MGSLTLGINGLFNTQHWLFFFPVTYFTECHYYNLYQYHPATSNNLPLYPTTPTPQQLMWLCNLCMALLCSLIFKSGQLHHLPLSLSHSHTHTHKTMWVGKCSILTFFLKNCQQIHLNPMIFQRMDHTHTHAHVCKLKNSYPCLHPHFPTNRWVRYFLSHILLLLTPQTLQ